jgi:hypothetical protein
MSEIIHSFNTAPIVSCAAAYPTYHPVVHLKQYPARYHATAVSPSHTATGHRSEFSATVLYSVFTNEVFLWGDGIGPYNYYFKSVSGNVYTKGSNPSTTDLSRFIPATQFQSGINGLIWGINLVDNGKLILVENREAPSGGHCDKYNVIFIDSHLQQHIVCKYSRNPLRFAGTRNVDPDTINWIINHKLDPGRAVAVHH